MGAPNLDNDPAALAAQARKAAEDGARSYVDGMERAPSSANGHDWTTSVDIETVQIIGALFLLAIGAVLLGLTLKNIIPNHVALRFVSGVMIGIGVGLIGHAIFRKCNLSTPFELL